MEENEFDLEEKVKKGSQGKKPDKEPEIDIPDHDDAKDKIPPVGWKKSWNPFADNRFVPPGWKKVGDTYAEE